MMNAEKAINHLIYLKIAHDLDAKHIINKEALDYAIKAIEQNPVKEGKWFGTVCSNCGDETSFYYDCEYCPHCGASMEVEE